MVTEYDAETELKKLADVQARENFLRRFNLLKKLKRQRPAARPHAGKMWSECYTEAIRGKLMLWYDIPVGEGKMSTGAVGE
jgi:hypothetical protein